MDRQSHRRSYGGLKQLIQRSLEGCPDFGSRIEIDGKLNRIPAGLWHENYWFRIHVRPNAYILRLLAESEDWQQGPERHDRLIREAETLQALEKSDFGHPTPNFVCFVRDVESEPIGMIETGLPGYSLHGHGDRSTLRIVSRVAANVHRLGIQQFPHLPSSSRTEHVMSRLAELEDDLFAEFPFAREVHDWIVAQVPSGHRSCVLHGDLLPQNLLYDWPTVCHEAPLVGVVDWEMARVGDPAYDLAIVSRGNRKVCGVKDGLEVLVEEYLESGGQPVSLTEIHVHELILVLRWLDEAWREYQKPVKRGHGPDFYEDKLQSLFRRAAG
jgi:aminoglycoside phosphotransferase (APT) family kinase protein